MKSSANQAADVWADAEAPRSSLASGETAPPRESRDATDANDLLQNVAARREREDRGASYEKLAFNFCKAATIMLLTWPLGRFALPFVAGVAAVFFALAHFYGQKETRCILQKPLVVAAFWSFVCVSSLLFLLRFRLFAPK